APPKPFVVKEAPKPLVAEEPEAEPPKPEAKSEPKHEPKHEPQHEKEKQSSPRERERPPAPVVPALGKGAKAKKKRREA
nr:YSIRK signal domain/LPXTG anchor domain surface protein [Myxococcota bacterium]